jgi:4-aminobutyrate aminotransferase/(S)-3-amino-2-methylpropionate transaminase
MQGALPELRTAIPGPRSRALADRLRAVECPEVTCQAPPPIVVERAHGPNIWDVDGNRLVDLMAGFGVAALGYAHPAIVAVTVRQAGELPHALGDVYPARTKIELLEALARVLPGALSGGIMGSSGSDAMEAALKTAMIATERPDVLAFERGYHGLGLGALDVTHRAWFKAPFRTRLASRTHFAPYGDMDAARRVARTQAIGAIVVEPIQGRGGIRPAPKGFLATLRELADETGALLIADEIYTGLGRTGHWLACAAEGVEPDVVALGKALGAGFPISVCLGRSHVMARWPASTGEALHTSTHLGNPLGCAIALAVLRELEAEGLPARARALGDATLATLRSALEASPHVVEVRGRGLMIGIELREPRRAHAVMMAALRRGWIVLPEGEHGEVLTLTPPLTIDAALLEAGTACLIELIETVGDA